MNKTIYQRVSRIGILTILAFNLLLAGCSSEPPLPDKLILYNWAEYMPQSVMDAFTHEYGVQVRYLVYESQEEAIANMRAGEVYDVVVMESRFIPLLAQEGLLAKLITIPQS